MFLLLFLPHFFTTVFTVSVSHVSLLLFLPHFFTTVFTAFLAGYPPSATHVQAEAAISLGAPVQYVTWVHAGEDVEGGGGGRGGGGVRWRGERGGGERGGRERKVWL